MSRSPGLECSYGKKIHPYYRDIGRKVGDPVTRPALLLIWTNRISIRRKERRGEISETEPARLPGPAHMKKPSSSNTSKSESGKSREDTIKVRLE